MTSQNPKKTRGLGPYEQNTREPSRPHAHNVQSYWKNVVSLKTTKAIVLKPFINIITVISRQLKKER